MRKILIIFWLLVPVGVAAYHFGPGQGQLVLDEAGGYIAEAAGYEKDGNWIAVVEAYDRALEVLPAEGVDATRRVRLARAKAQMHASQLPVAHADLETLFDELGGDGTADRKLVDETRSALANAQYYMTWLMRLEGVPRDVWEPEIEHSRQHYRVLAESAGKRGEAVVAREHRENLEASIRLARIDLSELQGLPLPSQ